MRIQNYWGNKMQEIHYEDGKKIKKYFDSFFDAIDDAKEKAIEKKVKKITITRVIPKKKKRKGVVRKFQTTEEAGNEN